MALTFNYFSFLYVYAPVVLLLLVSLIRWKQEETAELSVSLKRSLSLPIVLIAYILSGVVIQSFWAQIPIIRNVPYSQSNWDVFSSIWYSILLFFVYFYMAQVHKVSIVEFFGLRFGYLRFIVSVCGVLLVINLLAINIGGINLFLKPQEFELASIRSLDVGQRVLNLLISIVIAPVAEECVYRGLLYGPLRRKIGRWPAIAFSSAIWTHGHFLPIAPSIGLFITGVVLGWMYARSGSLVPPLILHVFKNSWLLLEL